MPYQNLMGFIKRNYNFQLTLSNGAPAAVPEVDGQPKFRMNPVMKAFPSRQMLQSPSTTRSSYGRSQQTILRKYK